MNKKLIITVVIVLAVIILGVKGKGLLEKRKTEVANEALPATETVSVPVVHATQGTLRHTEGYLAQIVSDKSIKLSTKLAGYIEKVYVSESQVVKKGDVLVSIDAIEIRSNIDALKATLLAQNNDLALAKSIYTRNQKLYKVGGLSKEKLDISKVTLQAKEAVITNTTQKIAQLEHQLSYLKIIAPFDGVVDAILMHESVHVMQNSRYGWLYTTFRMPYWVKEGYPIYSARILSQYKEQKIIDYLIKTRDIYINEWDTFSQDQFYGLMVKHAIEKMHIDVDDLHLGKVDYEEVFDSLLQEYNITK